MLQVLAVHWHFHGNTLLARSKGLQINEAGFSFPERDHGICATRKGAESAIWFSVPHSIPDHSVPAYTLPGTGSSSPLGYFTLMKNSLPVHSSTLFWGYVYPCLRQPGQKE